MVSRSNAKGVAKMGQAVLIIGESGTGKSASMRNFKRDEVTLLNVAKKALPFKGRFVNEVQGDFVQGNQEGAERDDQRRSR